MDKFDVFVASLERELYRRYAQCDAVVTPDSILLAVTNAVAAAREEANKLKDGGIFRHV